MNFEFLSMIIKLLVALGITLGLMFLSYKLLGTKVNNINNSKYIKVLERTQVTKENSILVIKVGKKGYVMTSTTQSMEKLDELSEDEINEIEENKKRANQEIVDGYNKMVSLSKNNILAIFKNIRSKEDRNEK